MKSILKNWLATNMLELSTWIGAIMFIREIFAIRPSTIMLLLSLVLVLVSDAKINAFIQARTPWLKKWIENL